MKKAYAQYQQSAQGVHEEKVQRLLDRAHIYNVTFLQNASRVHDIFVLFTDQSNVQNDANGIKNLPKMWEWLKVCERQACMS